MDKIVPCLWYDGQAEEAANFYVTLFPASRVDHVVRSPADNPSTPEGAVLVVDFTLAGRKYTALNGGPAFTFNEAISLEVHCETQDEIDYYWEKLSAGGDPKAQQCGWLKDRYGVSWQVVPDSMDELFVDAESDGSRRAMEAMLRMKKIDIAALREAYDGAVA